MGKKRNFIVTTLGMGAVLLFALKAAAQSVVGFLAWQGCQKIWDWWKGRKSR